ncbi:MAG: hypothetical protein ACTHOO_03560 [Alcanivorax sp.]
MGEHSFSDLKNPFMFAAMATLGCFVGHIFMYPLGLYEISGQAGAWLTNLFNPASTGAFMDPTLFSDMATPVATDATPFIDQSVTAAPSEIEHAIPTEHAAQTAFDPGPDGVFSANEAGFEECVASGGATHFHGPELVCHPTVD